MIKELPSIELLNDRISYLQKEKKIENVNCYLLSKELEELLINKKLCYAELDAGIFLFQKSDAFYRLFLYANPEITFQIPRMDKPIIVEFLSAKTISSKHICVIEHLKETGFSQNSIAHRMWLKLTPNSIAQDPVNWEDNKIHIYTATLEHKEGIQALWEETFDFVKSALPLEAELVDSIHAQEIICAIDDETKTIVGALQMQFSGKTCLSRHYAVAKSARGKSVGRALTALFHRIALEKGVERLYLWVSTEDAKQFHSHFGYVQDGRQLIQYYL